MAGSITVSSITLDSDNTFRILSNTGSSLYTLNSVNQTVTGNLSVDATGTTGIRAPSANTLVFYEGGVEAMRIDSSGNLILGTTAVAAAEGYRFYKNYGRYDNGTFTGFIGGGTSLGSAATTDFTFRSENALAFMSGGATERMRIDSSGNVGIGTNNPGGKLDVIGTSLFRGTAGGRTLKIAEGGVSTIGFDIESDTNSGDLTLSSAYSAGLIAFKVAGTERGRFDASGNFRFNSGYGSVATAYGCRAWVNFNGSGTVAIRASGNVSSITDNGVGIFAVNFTTAMPDTDYAIVGTTNNSAAPAASGGFLGIEQDSAVAPTTTSVQIKNKRSTVGLVDSTLLCVAIFR